MTISIAKRVEANLSEITLKVCEALAAQDPDTQVNLSVHLNDDDSIEVYPFAGQMASSDNTLFQFLGQHQQTPSDFEIDKDEWTADDFYCCYEDYVQLQLETAIEQAVLMS